MRIWLCFEPEFTKRAKIRKLKKRQEQGQPERFVGQHLHQFSFKITTLSLFIVAWATAYIKWLEVVNQKLFHSRFLIHHFTFTIHIFI